jgi:dUTP pyrophosphatase
MAQPILEVQILSGDEDLGLPGYATEGSAGLDLKASLKSPMILQPGERAIISTGLKLAIPEGYEGCVRPRSGLAAQKGITLTNAPGTIDSDYRGEIKILLINLGKEAVTFQRGDRIAQLVITPVARVQIVQVQQLNSTHRGEGGLGHTGI